MAAPTGSLGPIPEGSYLLSVQTGDEPRQFDAFEAYVSYAGLQDRPALDGSIDRVLRLVEAAGLEAEIRIRSAA